jgi:hypothetical protein
MISRRRFGQAFAAGLAATSLAACSTTGTPTVAAPASAPDLRAGSGEHSSLGEVKHADAGVLTMAYHEFGPATGQPVVLLHGWPYDPYSYVDVAPILAAAGYRVIVPYLRGYGPTAFKSAETVRNGQQTAVARWTSSRCWTRSRSTRPSSAGTTGAAGPSTSSPRCGRSAARRSSR